MALWLFGCTISMFRQGRRRWRRTRKCNVELCGAYSLAAAPLPALLTISMSKSTVEGERVCAGGGVGVNEGGGERRRVMDGRM